MALTSSLSVIPTIALGDSAAQATEFYTQAFGELAVVPNNARHLLTIGGLKIRLSDETDRTLTPAVSFMVQFHSEEQLRTVWNRLLADDSAAALMPLAQYDFAPLFGWVADRFGVNWQLMLSDAANGADNDATSGAAGVIAGPYFMWTGDEPQAIAATEVYTQIFGEQPFFTLDSPGMHNFGFGDGIYMTINSADGSTISSAQRSELEQLLGIEFGASDKSRQNPSADRFGVYWEI